MATITAHYGVPGPVPFEDVELSCDNLRFIDPHLIRMAKAPQPFSTEATRCLDSFFNLISRAAMTRDQADRAHALSCLQQFTEPWETRLGMASAGFLGHGGAEDIGYRIWQALDTDLQALLQVSILKHLEELPLFVQGVGRDITSDITTRIVFGPLADFTELMVSRYPQLAAAPHSTAHLSRHVWDSVAGRWTTRLVELPSADGRPLILVPKQWVRHDLVMAARRFYETTLLSYVQDERAVALPDGTVIRIPKARLKKQPGLARGRRTNLDVTLRAVAAGDDLIEMFSIFVKQRMAETDSDAA